jgi:hypothetical protein
MPKRINSENSETMRAAKTVADPKFGSTVTTGLTTNTINTLQSDKQTTQNTNYENKFKGRQ